MKRAPGVAEWTLGEKPSLFPQWQPSIPSEIRQWAMRLCINVVHISYYFLGRDFLEENDSGKEEI